LLIFSPSKLAALLLLILSLACTRCARAEVKITAVANTIQLKDNQTFGPVSLLVRIDGSKSAPAVRILSVNQTGPSVALKGDPKAEVSLQNGIFWKVPASITDLPLGSSANVFLVVEVEKTISDVLTFSITNTPVIPDADVNPSGSTVFTEDSRDMDLTVNLKGMPLRGVTVCRAALADATTGSQLPARSLGLFLTDADLAANPQVNGQYLTLAAPSSKVHLYVSPSFKDDGVFAGTIDLCAANKPSVAKLSITVNSSSRCQRVLGATLILVGIAVYLLVTVFLRQRSRRLTALLPASRLVAALKDLKTSAKQVSSFAGVKLHVLLGNASQDHSLENLIEQLSVKVLDNKGYLPAPLLANPFFQADLSADYQQYLRGISTQELNDATIVGDGLKRVQSIWPMLDVESARHALLDLDHLATRADTADPMRPQVDTIVTGIAPRHQDVSRNLVAAHLDYRAGGQHTPSVQEILIELDYVSFLGWIIWALLTFVLGYAALILDHHGFGSLQDLFKCFLWGLGVQAAGQGLQSLSPSAATTTFSLQIGH
jgi:hypothetical protein